MTTSKSKVSFNSLFDVHQSAVLRTILFRFTKFLFVTFQQRLMYTLLLLAVALPVPICTSQVLGVHPSLQHAYSPSNTNTWKCLDGSREIPFSAVNDDYCDCLDGTDEPGNCLLV
jgi:hypothetical protein